MKRRLAAVVAGVALGAGAMMGFAPAAGAQGAPSPETVALIDSLGQGIENTCHSLGTATLGFIALVTCEIWTGGSGQPRDTYIVGGSGSRSTSVFVSKSPTCSHRSLHLSVLGAIGGC